MVRRQNCSENSATLYIQICHGISGAYFCAASIVMESHFIFLVERRRRAFTLLHASVQWSEFPVVPLGSKFIKRPSSSQKNITMTFPANTLELLLSPPPPPPRVCHKAPFHRLPLEFRFKMVDPGSIRHDNLQQETLTSSAALVQKTSGPCFPRLHVSFQHSWTQRRQSLQQPSFLTNVLTLPLLMDRVQHN